MMGENEEKVGEKERNCPLFAFLPFKEKKQGEEEKEMPDTERGRMGCLIGMRRHYGKY